MECHRRGRTCSQGSSVAFSRGGIQVVSELGSLDSIVLTMLPRPHNS